MKIMKCTVTVKTAIKTSDQRFGVFSALICAASLEKWIKIPNFANQSLVGFE